MRAYQVIIFLTSILSVLADDWSKFEIKPKVPKFFKPQLTKPSSYEKRGRIVGGWEVERNSHPYQVGLLFGLPNNTRTLYLCGGSIINNRTILTAAHCTEGTDRVDIVAGAHYLLAAEDSQQRFHVNSSRYRCHYGYNSLTLNYDICIIFLNEEMVFNEFVQPIELPRAAYLRERSFVAELATVSGWGRYSDGSRNASDVLRGVQNIIISNEDCVAVYGTRLVVDSTICMRTVGQATCNGDSGGPLTAFINRVRLQIGIVSFGSAIGCETDKPDGFARITSFIDWIDYILRRG